MTSFRFRTIRQRVMVDASPSEVYEMYVDAKKHAEFTGSAATGVARVGSSFSAWDGYISGKFLELKQGQRIVQEWRTTEWPEGYPSSVVEVSVERKGKKTQLTIVHSSVPAEQADNYARGWTDYYWEPLKRHFSRASHST